MKDLGAGRRFLTRLPVKTAGRLLVIDLADVDCITAADNYVTIHAAGQQYLARETLGGLERDLDPARFVRIHRSTIVQVDRIKELLPDFHGDFTVVLHNGARVDAEPWLSSEARSGAGACAVSRAGYFLESNQLTRGCCHVLTTERL